MRKIRIVFLAREAFLLRRSDDLACDDQGGRTVVIKGRHTSMRIPAPPQRSEQRVNERCDRAALREDEKPAEREHDDEEWQQPIFFPALARTATIH